VSGSRGCAPGARPPSGSLIAMSTAMVLLLVGTEVRHKEQFISGHENKQTIPNVSVLRVSPAIASRKDRRRVRLVKFHR
jgi:hypothetical protein